MRFLYRKPLFKNVFAQNFFICEPIFKIFAAHFATNYMRNCAKKIFLLHLNSCKISAKNHYHTLRNRLKYINYAVNLLTGVSWGLVRLTLHLVAAAGK